MNDDYSEPESMIPYDEWMIDGMRRIMYLALWQTAERGLPGDHHFFVTFKTQHPSVSISPSLMARFPTDMRIVIQHQYGNLEVDEDKFTISLQFGGVPETLVVPFKAVSQFVDPSVEFALDFEVEFEADTPSESGNNSGPRLVSTSGNVAQLSSAGKTTPEQSEAPRNSAEPSENTDAAEESTSKVVTLDAFRKQKQKDENNE